MQHSSMDK